MPFKLCYLRELDKALFKEVAYEAMLVHTVGNGVQSGPEYARNMSGLG